MKPITVTIISLALIFAATTFGSALVFVVRKKLSNKVSNLILGFASGIMVAAGIFGLLLPSIEEAKTIYQNIALLPVAGGFIAGGLILTLLDKVVPHFHHQGGESEGPESNLSQQIKFLFAVGLHNIPEGLAVGFACGLALSSGSAVSVAGALSLAIGIAIQNVPEGSAVSIPLLDSNISRPKAFLYGTLTGVVEPIFGLVGIFLATYLTPLMPWLLAFASGAMIYVTIDELLPAARKGGHEHFGIWAFMIGFMVMLALELI